MSRRICNWCRRAKARQHQVRSSLQSRSSVFFANFFTSSSSRKGRNIDIPLIPSLPNSISANFFTSSSPINGRNFTSPFLPSLSYASAAILPMSFSSRKGRNFSMPLPYFIYLRAMSPTFSSDAKGRKATMSRPSVTLRSISSSILSFPRNGSRTTSPFSLPS